MASYGNFIIRHNILVSLGCVGVMTAFVFGVVKFDGTLRVKTSVKLMKLFSPGAEIVNHYAWLEQHIGPLVPLEVVLTIDNEKCDMSFLNRMRLAQTCESDRDKARDDVGAPCPPHRFSGPHREAGFGILPGAMGCQ